MVFQWFKTQNNKKTNSRHNHSLQCLLILPTLQAGHQIDFIYQIENQSVQYVFDLSLLLQHNEIIEQVNYENKDTSLQIKDFIYQKDKFTITVEGGWDNCKSTILFNVETNTKKTYSFTVLVTIISHYKNERDLDREQRKSCLWALDCNPEMNYIQENQEPWIEGDMVLNIHNRYLWEYRKVNEQQAWVPLFVMNGAIDPVDTIYSDAQNPGERLILNQIHSDEGKIKSNAKGNLSIKGEVTADAIYTTAVVAGHPLGGGMLFTSQGMIAGHSLYVGSPESKPKNIYLGVPGVVSAKLVSADYLQMALLSTKDIPTQVTKGTLILCLDYTGYSDLVLLYATKDNPQSITDWKPLFSSENVTEKKLPSQSPARPYLYPVSFNPHISKDKPFSGNVVEMKSAVSSKSEENNETSVLQNEKHKGVETYTRLQIERENIPVSIEKKILWKNLEVFNKDKQLKGEGQQYWSEIDHCWEAPGDGLLHIQGWFTFSEEQLKSSEPISYHAGDIFMLNLACNQHQTDSLYSDTQLEFPMIPYVNDATHQICASQQIPFSIVYPVKKGDKITIACAYMHQHTAFDTEKELSIKKAVITLFM